MYGVIGIDEHYVIPPGNVYSEIAGCRHSPVGCMLHYYPAISDSKLIADFAGIICGTVVDENHLDIPVGLPTDAMDTLLKERCCVEYRDYYSYFRHEPIEFVLKC